MIETISCWFLQWKPGERVDFSQLKKALWTLAEFKTPPEFDQLQEVEKDGSHCVVVSAKPELFEHRDAIIHKWREVEEEQGDDFDQLNATNELYTTIDIYVP